MIGCIGADSNGATLKHALEAECIDCADVIVCQLETPRETVRAALAACSARPS